MPVWWVENTGFIQKWKGFFPLPLWFFQAILPMSLCTLPDTKPALPLHNSPNYLNLLHVLQARHLTLRCYSEEHHINTYGNRNTRGLPAAKEHWWFITLNSLIVQAWNLQKFHVFQVSKVGLWALLTSSASSAWLNHLIHLWDFGIVKSNNHYILTLNGGFP